MGSSSPSSGENTTYSKPPPRRLWGHIRDPIQRVCFFWHREQMGQKRDPGSPQLRMIMEPKYPKTPWDVMGCQNHLFGGPRGVTRRVWCFHRRGREPWGTMHFGGDLDTPIIIWRPMAGNLGYNSLEQKL